MPGCELCAGMKSQEIVLFEDPHSIVMLHPRGAAPGHLFILPRVHYPIMEQVPEEELRQLFRVARLMLLSLEKGISAGNFNLLIMNGPAAGQEFPHFAIHLLPRGEGDAVKLAWEPIGISKEDMDDIEAKLKAASGEIRAAEKEKPEITEEMVAMPKDVYPLRQVRRIP